MKSNPYDRTWTPIPHCVREYLTQPMRYRKPCAVRVGFDMFNSAVSDGVIDRVFAVMAMCPQHTFQVLTKKPERMADYLDKATRTDNLQEEMDRLTMLVEGEPFAYYQISDGGAWPLTNVWLGTSVENQATADERIPHLLRCPASVRFLSVEPLLEAVRLFEKACQNDGKPMRWRRDKPGEEQIHNGQYNCYECTRMEPANGIDWLIVGGESGPGARPCRIEHVRSLVRQAKDAGVPVWVERLGSNPIFQKLDVMYARNIKNSTGSDPAEWPEDLRVREWPKQQQEQHP